MKERLQKILSAHGLCSRRKAEEYIKEGLIRVNGEVAILGTKADPDVDKIEMDGKILSDRKEMVYYLMNKPAGIITSNVDAEGDKTVRDLLPKELLGTLYPVGRLDKETTGLLLFTNDGVLAYRLTHPKFEHEKQYEVTVAEEIKDGQLTKLKQGITISKEKTKPAKIKRLTKSSFLISLTEGRNRQIRRMCQKVGAPVIELKRVRIMTLSDSKLKKGDIRELTGKEKNDLLASVGL